MAEMKGFIFSVTFLIVFTGLIATMPTELFGYGGTATTIADVDPSLLTDFSDTENWTKSAYTNYFYSYEVGGYNWRAGSSAEPVLILDRKVYWLGLAWLGAVEHCAFFLANGTSRGTSLTMTEIEGDATDGAVRYNLQFTENSNDAGGFVVYWNSTLYPDPADAWTADKLNLLHGMGIDTTNAVNVVALLLGLLTFQIPDIPVLVNLIVVTPIAVCVIFLIWFIIKESLPFL